MHYSGWKCSILYACWLFSITVFGHGEDMVEIDRVDTNSGAVKGVN